MADDRVYLQTHRCKGSLGQKTPIRWCDGWINISGWWLYDVINNFDFDVIYIRPVALIKFCPFCGIELPNLVTQHKENCLS